MKKRSVCFGWTKGFQRRTQHARDLSAMANRATTGCDVAKILRDQSFALIAAIKLDHRSRVQQLLGVA